FNTQSLQAGLAAGAHVPRLAAHAAHLRVGTLTHDGELRGEKHLFTAIANGLADQNFVVAVAIDVGGVQKIHAEFNGAVNRGDGFGVIPQAVEFRHAHTAKAQGRNARTGFSKFAELHAGTSVEAYFKIDEWRPRPDTCPYFVLPAISRGTPSSGQRARQNQPSSLVIRNRGFISKL